MEVVDNNSDEQWVDRVDLYKIYYVASVPVDFAKMMKRRKERRSVG